MKILAVSSHRAILDELGKELADVFPTAEIIKETDALMAGKVAFNTKIDVVFADADMKRMNGLQLIQFVRQEHPDVTSFLMGSEKVLSESFFDVPEDATDCVAYPFAENAIRDLCLKCGK